MTKLETTEGILLLAGSLLAKDMPPGEQVLEAYSNMQLRLYWRRYKHRKDIRGTS